jgi:endonuclease I
MFGELDKLIDANGTYVMDVYCGKKFYFNNINDVSNMHDRVNIEHTWPQSRFNPRIAKDIQKSDMHHLYLSDSHANSIRGNSPFGVVDSTDDRMGGEGCDNSRMGLINGSVFYTPPASHRGNIARALFYFSMRYSLSIDKQEERVLRLWHKMDPIDDAELKRHEAIAKYQKTRNPFIDHSELVERVSDF